jgi:hypothetical protein
MQPPTIFSLQGGLEGEEILRLLDGLDWERLDGLLTTAPHLDGVSLLMTREFQWTERMKDLVLSKLSPGIRRAVSFGTAAA